MPITAAHIAPQGGGFEPQRAFDFEVELSAPGGDLIKLSVQDAFLPEVAKDIIEVGYMAEVRKVVGKVNFRDGQLVLVDYVDENTYGVLMEWSKLVYDPESGALGYATQYKKQGNIILVGPDGGAQRLYKIIGAWPSTVSGGPLSYTGSDTNKVNVTLTFDVAVPQF